MVVYKNPWKLHNPQNLMQNLQNLMVFAGESALSLGGDRVASLQNLVGLAELFPKQLRCWDRFDDMCLIFFYDMVAIWWKCINLYSIVGYIKEFGETTQVTCTCVNGIIMHHMLMFLGWVVPRCFIQNFRHVFNQVTGARVLWHMQMEVQQTEEMYNTHIYIYTWYIYA